ncbi:DUF5753 domain-containing protein [Streptacidiphilus sp. MAP5-3]|uniref:DUF5753 domain-containing protein n=1 Tax=unclassified Streptacidiphilus TaxID=2643834 RepID=UPI0035179538
MPNSSSSSQQEARERLARRLRALREDAGLSNAELSTRAGWSIAKTSRIEHAKQAASPADIAAWCEACGRGEAAQDLVAAAKAADELYRHWPRRGQSIRRLQLSAFAEFAEHKLIRSYCAAVVPGFLQVPDYIRAVLTTFAELQGIYRDADELDQAVTARLARRQLLASGHLRFVFLIDEAALWRRICAPEVMAEQLDFLLDAPARFPSLVLGIIPFGAQLAFEDFYLYDSAKVSVETISAYIQITEPAEIRLYERAYAKFAGFALYGPEGRELIRKARAALSV